MSYRFFRPKNVNSIMAAQCVYVLDICSGAGRVSAASTGAAGRTAGRQSRGEAHQVGRRPAHDCRQHGHRGQSGEGSAKHLRFENEIPSGGAQGRGGWRLGAKSLERTTARDDRAASMAAMKNVLSPISDTRIMPHDLRKPCVGRQSLRALACRQPSVLPRAASIIPCASAVSRSIRRHQQRKRDRTSSVSLAADDMVADPDQRWPARPPVQCGR